MKESWPGRSARGRSAALRRPKTPKALGLSPPARSRPLHSAHQARCSEPRAPVCPSRLDRSACKLPIGCGTMPFLFVARLPEHQRMVRSHGEGPRLGCPAQGEGFARRRTISAPCPQGAAWESLMPARPNPGPPCAGVQIGRRQSGCGYCGIMGRVVGRRTTRCS
jgi:hypothetical protein